MIPAQPLTGFQVLFPRGGEVAQAFAESIRSAGGEPQIIPLIDFREVDNAIPKLDRFNWVIFTSQNGVKYFMDQGHTLPPSIRVAAVGKKTADVIEARGIKVDFIPSLFVADVFVNEFKEFIQSGDHVLIPRGNLAQSTIKDYLLSQGVKVVDPIVYETYFPFESKQQLKDLLQGTRNDKLLIVFTSPSTVQHFMEVYSPLDKTNTHFTYAVIGSSTQKALQSYGIDADIIPSQYTFTDLFNEIIDHFKREVF